tara:strand:+ start:222 stop:527 length:306 start_codon:yes stop_codon:yes gene_type:complete
MENITGDILFPYFYNFTVTANMTQIKIPNSARRVTIGSQDHQLYLATNGAADGESPPTHKAFIPKSNYLSINMGRGNNRNSYIYVSSAATSAEVSLILEEE